MKKSLQSIRSAFFTVAALSCVVGVLVSCADAAAKASVRDKKVLLVASVLPQESAVEVPVAAVIRVVFDGALNVGMLTPSSLTLNGTVAGTVTYNTATRTARSPQVQRSTMAPSTR